jgi:dTDP-4-amino-4,6-dideoxygalactose transaminase
MLSGCNINKNNIEKPNNQVKSIESEIKKENTMALEIDNPKIVLPTIRDKATHTWHQFVIRTERRDELIQHLENNGIGSIIHYPIPPHLSEAYSYMGYKKGDFPKTEEYSNTVLSIPLYNGMTKGEQDYVIKTINEFR